MSSGRRIWVSSSSALLLERAAAWLRRWGPADRVWVVAPTLEAAEAALEARVGARQVCFGGRALTLEGLARALLEAAPGSPRGSLEEAGALARAALAARAIRGAEERGELGPFGPIADAPGLPRALARLIAELSLAEIPEARLRARHPTLGALAASYREEMGAAGLRDRGRALQDARARLLREDTGATARALPEALLLLDLPLRSPAEAGLVEALSRRIGALAVTLSRADRGSLSAFERILGVEAEALAPEAREEERGGLARLQEGLAGAPRASAISGRSSAVKIFSAASEDRECVEIARAISTLAREGARFEEVAILLRVPSLYAPHLMEALGRARIPAYFSRGSAQPDPSGRALLALLSCASEGISARAFEEYLSLDVLPELPEQGEEAESRGLARRWQRLIREAGVIGGLDRFRGRLADLEQELRSKRRRLADPKGAEAQGLERKLLELSSLRAHALPLLAELEALPERASWGEWLDRLGALAGRALRRPERVFELLTHLAPMAPLGPIDRAELRRVLAQHLSELRAPRRSTQGGAVWVGSLEEARGRSFGWVFVPGLAEGLFPRPLRDDPLLGEEAREALGGSLPRMRDRAEQERLALSIAASVASSGIFFSFPRADGDRGRARVPSFYALEVFAAAEGRLPSAEELTALARAGVPEEGRWQAPLDPTLAIDEIEHDLASLGRALSRSEEARYLLGANRHLARALRARARRWSTSRWSETEGALGEGAEEALRAYAPSRRAYSATALQRLAACPYRFYLESVMHLLPPDPPEAIRSLSPRDRGSLIHDTLYELFRRAEEAPCPFDPEREEELLSLLAEALREVGEEYERRLAPAFPESYARSLVAIEEELCEWLRGRLREQREGEPWRPFAVELGFGAAPGPRRDPKSVRAPLRILDGGEGRGEGGMLLCGSIDLVEQRGEALIAVDHKSAAIDAPEGLRVAGGRVLQPLLYALALEALYPERRVPGGRLDCCTSEGAFARRFVPLDEAARGAGEALLAALEGAFEGAAEGAFFPAAPQEGACAECPHRALCGPHEPERARHKKRAPLALLEALRRQR